MGFFDEFILTRIKERGWPKRRGLLRSRLHVSEGAVVAAMQDAVRVALAMGAYLPHHGMDVAATFTAGQEATKSVVDEWVSEAEALGAQKYDPEVKPIWMSLCSVTASNKAGEVRVVTWSPSADEYRLDDPLTERLFAQAESLAAIALGWSLAHPDLALEAINDIPPSDLPDDQQELLRAGEGFRLMAEMMVSEYREKVGLPSYRSLPA